MGENSMSGLTRERGAKARGLQTSNTVLSSLLYWFLTREQFVRACRERTTKDAKYTKATVPEECGWEGGEVAAWN